MSKNDAFRLNHDQHYHMIGHIYRVVNDVNEDVYIGSTIQTLTKRFKAHRSNANLNKPGRLYDLMREIGTGHFRIESLETIECVCISELREKEHSYFQSLKPSLNMIAPKTNIENKPGRIYIIKYNADTHYFYIGSTKSSLEFRLIQHRSASNKGTTPLYAFMRERGKEKFIIECLEDDIPTPDLIAREDHWIKLMKPTLNKNIHLMITDQERDRLKYLKNRKKRMKQIHERRLREREILNNTIIVPYESHPGFTHEMLKKQKILSLKIIARQFGILQFAPTKEELIRKIMNHQDKQFPLSS